MFSKRFSYSIEENRISKLLRKKKSGDVRILDLTESNPTKAGFDYAEAKVIKSITKTESLVYSPNPKGMLSAREAVSRYYKKKNIDIDTDNVFLVSSTSEAYSYVFKLLTNPFDEILIPRPSYPLFSYIAEMESLNPKYYDIVYSEDNFWEIDFCKIKSQITDKTKALILVNPNNPTGHFIKRKDYSELIEICKNNNLPIICDEVFYDYVLESDLEQTISLASVNDVLTFTLSGISKICGLPQMKISWLVVNGKREVCEEAKSKLEIIADTYLSVGTPIQYGIPEILENSNYIQSQIISRISKNYEFLKTEISKSNLILLLRTEGGWYSVLKIIKNIDEEILTFKLLKDKDVYIHPGYFFDFENDCNILVSLLTPDEIFREGIKRIIEFLKEIKS